MARPVYSPVAVKDLEQIDDYITEELKNPSAALKIMTDIQLAIEKLAETPGIGAPLTARYENVDDSRYLVCGSYLIFYHEHKNVIYIDRILYSKRDYITILFGEKSNEIM